MSFIYPVFLLSLLAIAIPILIHLYNWRKYQKVQFPDISFLEHVVITSKKYAQIQNWKLLLLRIALLFLLVFAFAQPILNRQNTTPSELMAIYIDNSMSMGVAKGQKTFFDDIKEAAKHVLKQLNPNQTIKWIDNNEILESISVNEALNKLNQLELRYNSKSLEEIYQAVDASENKPYKLFYFSDYQISTINKDNLKQSLNNDYLNVYFYESKIPTTVNTYIDTAYFLDNTLDVLHPNALVVRLRSNTKNLITSQLQILQDNKAISFLNAEIKEGIFVDTIDLTTTSRQWQQFTIVASDNGLSFDDTFRISILQHNNQEVDYYYGQSINPYIDNLFKGISNKKLNIQKINSLSTTSSKNTSTIIIDQFNHFATNVVSQLNNWCEDGKNILIAPATDIDIASFNEKLQSISGITLANWDTTKQIVFNITQHHPFFRNVFEEIDENTTLPIIYRRLLLNVSLQNSPQYLMKFKDGIPFIFQCKVKNGMLTFINTPLDKRYTDFISSSYFAPFIYNFTNTQSLGAIFTATIHQDIPILLPNLGRDVWKLNKEHESIIPIQKSRGNSIYVSLQDIDLQPGIYTLHHPNSADAYYLAVNPNTLESQLAYESINDVTSLFKNTNKVHILNSDTGTIHAIEQDNDNWWKYLIILAGLVFIVETFISSKYKFTSPNV
jgi:hypothetical protein